MVHMITSGVLCLESLPYRIPGHCWMMSGVRLQINPVEQVELEVVEGNERAKALYEHLGFQETGKHLHALKYDDGNYRDEYTMVKFL